MPPTHLLDRGALGGISRRVTPHSAAHRADLTFDSAERLARRFSGGGEFWTGPQRPGSNRLETNSRWSGRQGDSDEGYVMKRNDEAATAKPLLSRGGNGAPTPKQAAHDETIAQAHQELMTRGERVFCLRDVHRYWSTPRISIREVEELERENLIERSPNPICSIRLTEQGVRMKNWKPLKVS